MNRKDPVPGIVTNNKNSLLERVLKLKAFKEEGKMAFSGSISYQQEAQ
jgi:hypothetical protein